MEKCPKTIVSWSYTSESQRIQQEKTLFTIVFPTWKWPQLLEIMLLRREVLYLLVSLTTDVQKSTKIFIKSKKKPPKNDYKKCNIPLKASILFLFCRNFQE